MILYDNVQAHFCDIGNDKEALLRVYSVLLYHHKNNPRLLNQMKSVHYLATIVSPKYYYY